MKQTPRTFASTRMLAAQVAQICNLLYRRFAICEALPFAPRSRRAEALPNAIRRYSRLQICATGSWFRCAGALTALVLLLGAPGCGKKEEGGGPPSGGASGGKKLKLAFVTNNTSDVWTIARAGSQDAEKALVNVEVHFRIAPRCGPA